MKYVNEKIYAQYEKHIKGGLSKAEACRRVNVPSSTMYSYIKRMKAKEDRQNSSCEQIVQKDEKFYDYAFGVSTQNRFFIIDGVLYKFAESSEFAVSNEQLIYELVRRPSFEMSESEYSIFKQLNVDEQTLKSITEVAKVIPIKITDDALCYKGVVLPKTLLTLVRQQIKNKVRNSYIVKFVDLLIQNPDQRVIEQLYDFLLHNDIDICPNGYILAYKAVNKSMRDHRTNKIDNSVKQVVSMNRDDVDSNPDNVCSRGLHVASKSYIKQCYNQHSSKLIQCIINPKDFVSVPTDYNGGKARVCKYKVVKIAEWS